MTDNSIQDTNPIATMIQQEYQVILTLGSGKDLISGRELSTGEQITRAAFGTMSIVGGGYGLNAFSQNTAFVRGTEPGTLNHYGEMLKHSSKSNYIQLNQEAQVMHSMSTAPVLPKVEEVSRSNKVILEINNSVLDSPRAGSGLKVDNIQKNSVRAHGFSDIIDNYAGFADVTDLGNAKLYQIHGSQNGVIGRFEWIIQHGNVTHRMFVRNPELNGVPIK